MAEIEVDGGGRTLVDERVARHFNHRTRVWHNVIPSRSIDRLIDDATKAYLKVKTTTSNLGIPYETNATYWVSADAQPQTAIEMLVQDIFHFHTRDCPTGSFDMERSGAEWWTQVVDSDKDIKFHWDRDYELQREQGVCIHPHLGTVTYLTDVGGAPTIVLPAASPLDADEVATTCHGKLSHASACWPVRGRHLAFDGRLLHGAPTGIGGGATIEDDPVAQKRVTLLVNVWFNHIPCGADPLHQEVVDQLSRERVRPDFTTPCRPIERHIKAIPYPTIRIPWGRRGHRRYSRAAAASPGVAHTWSLCGFGQELETEGTLELRLPVSSLWERAERAAAGSFLVMRWDDGLADLRGCGGNDDGDSSDGDSEEEDGSFDEALLRHFLHAQELSEDAPEEAMAAYLHLVREAEAKAQPAPESVRDEAIVASATPPPSLLVSVALASVGLAHVEGGQLSEARAALKRSVEWWPANGMALVKLGDIAHGDGCARDAFAYYEAAARLPPLGDVPDAAWCAAWVEEPRRESVRIGSYMCALLLEQALRPEDALAYVRRFRGVRHRLAPNVWRLVAGVPPLAGAASASAKRSSHKRRRDEGDGDGASSGVRRFDSSSTPAAVLEALQRCFAPTSSFWVETAYASRGASSFWYDVGCEPRNAVEVWARHVLARLGDAVRARVVGCEWWVHIRSEGGRSVGHPLHFDTEEATLARGEVLHPLVSSVTYVRCGRGASDPTVILDQRVGEDDAGWAIASHPQEGALLLFPSNLLHGALPRMAAGALHAERGTDRDAVSTAAPGAHRVTLMINFWDRRVNEAERPSTGRKGGAAPRVRACQTVPRATRTCTWPAALEMRAGAAAPGERSGTAAAGPAEVALPRLDGSPWERIVEAADGDHGASGDDQWLGQLELPAERDARFFVKSLTGFLGDRM